MKARIALNPAIAGNYSFVCPVSSLCLNTINRVGYTSIVSPSILRGLIGKTLIDVDGVIDVEAGEFIKASKPEVVKVEPKVEPKVEVKAESVKKEEIKKEEAPKAPKSKTSKKSTPKPVHVEAEVE